MNNSPKVSLVVPVYKVPSSFLKVCIDSCLNQTLKEIEIIIVQDGGHDDCYNICIEYEKKDSRVKLISGEQRLGMSGARNLGVKNASAEWFMFVDGDDFIEPNMVEEMYSATINCFGIDVVLCGTLKTSHGKSVPVSNYANFADYQVFMGDECKELLRRSLNYNSMIAEAYSKLIRTQFALQNNVFHDDDLKQGVEGLDFCVRLFSFANGAVFLKKYFYHYVYNDDSMSVVVSKSTVDFIVEGFNKINNQISLLSNTNKYYDELIQRIKFSIVSCSLRGFFNPKVERAFKERIALFNDFVQNPLINRAFKSKNSNQLSFSRKIVLFALRAHLYHLVFLIAKMNLRRLKRKVL